MAMSKTAIISDLKQLRYFKGKPNILRLNREEDRKEEFARIVHELRTQAGLTREQLAERLETSVAIIARMEDADYDLHNLGLVQKIADACGMEMLIAFAPVQAEPEPVSPPPVKPQPFFDSLTVGNKQLKEDETNRTFNPLDTSIPPPKK